MSGVQGVLAGAERWTGAIEICFSIDDMEELGSAATAFNLPYNAKQPVKGYGPLEGETLIDAEKLYANFSPRKNEDLHSVAS